MITSELNHEIEEAIACLVLDAGLSYEEAEKQVNAVLNNKIEE